MKAIHFICRRDENGSLLNLLPVKEFKNIYQSGNWDLTKEVADSLIGGWVYLHPTKAKPSEFGGIIRKWSNVLEKDKAHSDRVVFEIEAKLDAKGKMWRGTDHAMAWQSGIVEADYAHEKSF